MYTVIETPVYSNKVNGILTEDERYSFAVFIASNPKAGTVVRGSGCVRKVRWIRSGRGKSVGARIIYFNRLLNEEIWLLVIYSKSVKGNIPAHILKAIREVIENE